MSAMTREQIKLAAMQLDPAEREALAEELLLSLDDKERDAIDHAWLEEVDRREKAFAARGGIERTVDEAIDRLKRKGRA